MFENGELRNALGRMWQEDGGNRIWHGKMKMLSEFWLELSKGRGNFEDLGTDEGKNGS